MPDWSTYSGLSTIVAYPANWRNFAKTPFIRGRYFGQTDDGRGLCHPTNRFLLKIPAEYPHPAASLSGVVTVVMTHSLMGNRLGAR